MKTNDISHSFTRIQGNEKTVIKLQLNDECKNGHEDFSLTADIYKQDGRRIWRDIGGGCCHDRIRDIMPELAPFAALHLSTWEGVPMHAITNAWYWFQGAFQEAADSQYHGGTGRSGKSQEECKRIFAEHIRAIPEQVETIAGKFPRSQAELQFVLEEMGFPAQWKAEAQAAIRQLEQWTGAEFESRATRQTWQPLTDEQRADIMRKHETGYYLPENIAKRDAEAKEAVKQKKLAELHKDFERDVATLKRKFDVETHLVETFGHKLNLIYYDYTNELSANWSSCEKLLTKAEFDAITQALDFAKLPQGIKLVWNERPKY